MSCNGQRSSNFRDIRQPEEQRLDKNMKTTKLRIYLEGKDVTGIFKNLAKMCNATPDTEQTTSEIPGLGIRRSYNPRALHPIRTASEEERKEAIEKALKIEKDLGSAHPLFLKPMLPSHVSGGFWLGLPIKFCSQHMPENDDWFNLEDEDGKLTPSCYKAKKTGFSAGWRGFAISHSLQDGDCLIFQKTNSTQFKVFIVRVEAKDAIKESDGSQGNDKANGEVRSKSGDIRKGIRQNKKRNNASQNGMTKKLKTDKKSQDHSTLVGTKRPIPKNRGRKPKSKGANDRRLTQMLPTKKKARRRGQH